VGKVNKITCVEIEKFSLVVERQVIDLVVLSSNTINTFEGRHVNFFFVNSPCVLKFSLYYNFSCLELLCIKCEVWKFHTTICKTGVRLIIHVRK
jgi:hypothetical protein